MVLKNINMAPARHAVRLALLNLYNEAMGEITRLGGLWHSGKAGNSRKPAPRRIVTRIKRLNEAAKIAWEVSQKVCEQTPDGSWVLERVPQVELWSLMSGQDRATVEKMGTYHKYYRGRLGGLYSKGGE